MPIEPPAVPSHPTAPDPGWIDRLGAMLAEQVDLAQQLDALSREQSEALDDGRVDHALEVLQLRQPLVDRLSQLSSDLEPLAARLTKDASELDPARRQPLMEDAHRLEDLIEQVNQRDARDRLSLEQARQAIGAEIAGLDRGRSMMNAYGPRPAADPSFQDREV